MSLSYCQCIICLEEDKNVFYYCPCKSTHRDCLYRWQKQKIQYNSCDICKYNYKYDYSGFSDFLIDKTHSVIPYIPPVLIGIKGYGFVTDFGTQYMFYGLHQMVCVLNNFTYKLTNTRKLIIGINTFSQFICIWCENIFNPTIIKILRKLSLVVVYEIYLMSKNIYSCCVGNKSVKKTLKRYK